MTYRRKSWKPHRLSRLFISQLQNAVRATNGQKDRCQIVVFCGAGFAKAWSVRSPLASDLFSVSTRAFVSKESLLRLLEYLRKGANGQLNQDDLKDINSFLDLCQHHDFLLGSLMDRFSPQQLKTDLARAIKDYFRDIHYINHLKDSTELLPVKSKKSPHRKPMIQFLTQLLHDRCEYTQDHSGIDLCFVTTNYDYSVESWIQESTGEPILNTLYRGFTPSHINGNENTQYLMNNPYGLKLLKLNGGFEIAGNSTAYTIDYRNSNTNPVLILPSSYQDYGAEYFKCVFDKAALAFSRADLALFVGYSFSHEDILIRRLIALFVEDQRPGKRKQIICINRKGSQTVKERLTELFGTSGPTTPNIAANNLEFGLFCEGCNYYYRKLRDGFPLN